MILLYNWWFKYIFKICILFSFIVTLITPWDIGRLFGILMLAVSIGNYLKANFKIPEDEWSFNAKGLLTYFSAALLEMEGRVLPFEYYIRESLNVDYLAKVSQRLMGKIIVIHSMSLKIQLTNTSSTNIHETRMIRNWLMNVQFEGEKKLT